MKEILIDFEYAMPDGPLGLAFLSAIAALASGYTFLSLVENYESRGTSFKRYAMVAMATVCMLGAMGFVNGFVQDEHQNDRDRASLKAGFETLLAGVDLTQADELLLENAVEDSTDVSRGDTEEIKLTVGKVTMAYSSNEDHLGLTFTPGEEDKE